MSVTKNIGWVISYIDLHEFRNTLTRQVKSIKWVCQCIN